MPGVSRKPGSLEKEVAQLLLLNPPLMRLQQEVEIITCRPESHMAAVAMSSSRDMTSCAIRQRRGCECKIFHVQSRQTEVQCPGCSCEAFRTRCCIGEARMDPADVTHYLRVGMRAAP